MRHQVLGRGTWLETEEAAYPHGGMRRRGVAIWPDGKLRRVFGGIPDTFFSIPACGRFKGRYIKGFLTIEGDESSAAFFQFHVMDTHKGLLDDHSAKDRNLGGQGGTDVQVPADPASTSLQGR